MNADNVFLWIAKCIIYDSKIIKSLQLKHVTYFQFPPCIHFQFQVDMHWILNLISFRLFKRMHPSFLSADRLAANVFRQIPPKENIHTYVKMSHYATVIAFSPDVLKTAGLQERSVSINLEASADFSGDNPIPMQCQPATASHSQWVAVPLSDGIPTRCGTAGQGGRTLYWIKSYAYNASDSTFSQAPKSLRKIDCEIPVWRHGYD